MYLTPHVLHLSTSCRSLSRPARSTSRGGGTARQYPLNRRLGGPKGRSGCVEEELNLLPCQELNDNLSTQPAQTVALFLG